MPVIPNPAEFPSASQKGHESQNKTGEQREKASATDFISKGPQIPDGMCKFLCSELFHAGVSKNSSDCSWSDMPPKASKEEIEARKKELNKSTK